MALLKGRRRGLVAAVCLAAFCRSLAVAQRDSMPEYQVKAAFLFNFAHFVEWPGEAFTDATSPVVIGVFGDDPFGSYLDDIVRGETVSRRRLVIERYRTVEEIGACHILFVPRSEAIRMPAVLAHVRGRSVLTVSDLDGGADPEEAIRLVTENSRIRMRINLEAARAARLTISSKLLRPAEIVSPRENGK
jgi:hypothetical protein